MGQQIGYRAAKLASILDDEGTALTKPTKTRLSLSLGLDAARLLRILSAERGRPSGEIIEELLERYSSSRFAPRSKGARHADTDLLPTASVPRTPSKRKTPSKRAT